MKPKHSINKELQVTFRIENIQVLNFCLDNSPKHQELPLDYHYTIDIKAEISVNSEQKIIGIDLTSLVFTTPTKDDKVCELSIRHNFKVENFSELVTIKDMRISLPNKLIEHFIALSYSTTRGIFFEKVQGSFLSSFILPVLDITKFKKTENNISSIQQQV